MNYIHDVISANAQNLSATIETRYKELSDEASLPRVFPNELEIGPKDTDN